MNTKIGFIGQGWIGKHYADEFESRLYNVVRYALENPYQANKDKIKDCRVVFVAVPTPTTTTGFDYTAVQDAISNTASDTIVVVKSTLLPGTTEKLQNLFPDRYVLHNPEFLAEVTAAHDAAKPQRNIIGIPTDNNTFKTKAELVMRILPAAPYQAIMSAREAECVKYAGNGFLFTKVLFFNLLYDFVSAHGGNWEVVREAVVHDPRIGAGHTQPVHTSTHDTGHNTTPKRGAGGHCFIKDFEAFRQQYEAITADKLGDQVLTALVTKNKQLLIDSQKDLDLLEDVYGQT